MAGIGFNLIKLIKQDSYRSLLKAYGLTTLVSVGPGVFIIIGLALVCFFTLFAVPTAETANHFFSIVVYLFSSSMIISSLLQFAFFRYVADKIYASEFNKIAPNFIGVLLLQLITSIVFALIMIGLFFSEYSFDLQILLMANFIILSLISISTVLLTGFKSYRRILWAFILGYSAMIILHFFLENNTLPVLLSEFLLAQVILFSILLHAILEFYPGNLLIQFDFLKKENLYYTLIFSNFFYTLGFWADKYLFWMNPDTSYVMFAPLRASPLYDLPLFIAFVAVIPGMASFLFQIEARFSMIYPDFMKSIFDGKTLEEIASVRNELTISARDIIDNMFKTQYVVTVAFFLSISLLFSFFSIIPLYLNILLILVVAMGLNIILWGLMNILYYMTSYLQAVYVALVFMVTNVLLTLLSFYSGPAFFGYGLALSSLIAIIFALILLNKTFEELEYRTFMMND